jgi:hypothetical protein
VKPAFPIFNNPIGASPPNRSFDNKDSRFPAYLDSADSSNKSFAYPGPPIGNYPQGSYAVKITCKPNNNTSRTEIACTADLPGGTSQTTIFKSATPDTNDNINNYFPYAPNSPSNPKGPILPWTPICNQAGANVRCLVETLIVTGAANMMIKTESPLPPVEIFLRKNMTIDPDSKLSGDNWSKLRIFGVTPGESCDSQDVNVSSTSNEINLQNAFLWLSHGRLKYQSIPQNSPPKFIALVGSVCPIDPTKDATLPTSTSLSNRAFMEGLGGAYRFNGVFGAPASPIRFIYRGFGFSEQNISS